jgi:hypothetical protein
MAQLLLVGCKERRLYTRRIWRAVRSTGAAFLRRLRGRWQDGRVPSPLTIAPLLVAELHVDGERWPVYVHVIDQPDARVLVDTGVGRHLERKLIAREGGC